MRKSSILNNLRLHLKWLSEPMEKNFDHESHAINIKIGCLQCLAQCGQSIKPWLIRKPHRNRVLINISRNYTTSGRLVLRELVRLTISAVEACTFVSVYTLGALPARKEPDGLTDAERKTLAAERDQPVAAAKKRLSPEERRAWQQARFGIRPVA